MQKGNNYSNFSEHNSSAPSFATNKNSWITLDIQTRFKLVLVSNDAVILFELLVVTNTKHHLSAANSRKLDCYSSLLLDLQCTGLTAQLVTIEIGCLGHFTPTTLTNASHACKLPSRAIKSLFDQAARIAISCSYRIFNARNSELWDLTDLLD